MARGISRIGTSRSAIAADIAQKPPSATPSTTRASRSTVSDEAKVARRLERIRKHRQHPHHQPAVHAPGDDGHGGRGNGADDRGRRHRLPGHAFGDAEIARHRRQQAGRKEFRRDETEHPKRQRDHGTPCRFGSFIGVCRVQKCGVDDACSGFGHGQSPVCLQRHIGNDRPGLPPVTCLTIAAWLSSRSRFVCSAAFGCNAT